MTIRFRPHPVAGKDSTRGARRRSTDTGKTMRWEKPQAVDFRFGMEITMYIANR
jgi:coenzyme PQQ precursor peptide PqqA